MIKEKINNQKGITIISLILTIVIILILSSIIIISIDSSNNVSPYNNMKADITLLEDKISIYYNKYGEVPKTSRSIQITHSEVTITYYEIDLSKLDDLTLNYGSEFGKAETLIKDSSDVYAVNESLQVYYIKGVELDDVKIYEN